jgi:hypothetical protein
MTDGYSGKDLPGLYRANFFFWRAETTMNRTLLQEYRTAYRQNFSQIRQEEGYKWRAVQHFQAHWDADADDFAAMLAAALAETSNLMNAGNYYPKRMILKTADANPALVRQAFLELFDENADLEGRMKAFRQHVSALVEQRAIAAILSDIDAESNIISVCPNHHAELDMARLTLHPPHHRRHPLRHGRRSPPSKPAAPKPTPSNKA